MQNFNNGRKHPAMLSDYELSQQLNQLIDWATLSANAKELLATVSRRMEFADHMAPLVPSADRVANLSICFDTQPDKRLPDGLAYYLDETFRSRNANFGLGDFANKIYACVDDRHELDWHHSGPYSTKHGIEVAHVIVEYKPDHSDFRVICIGKTDHGVARALMITRADVYPFYIRLDGEPRQLTQKDFLFWSYNAVYRDVTVDSVSSVITYNIHMYNAGKAVQYVHEIKG